MMPIEAIAAYGARLELLKRDFDVATAEGAEDWQIRSAAFHSVLATIEFMRVLPGMDGLDFGLVRMLEALSSVEKGSTPSWLLNGTDGRPGVADRVLVLRARYAAVMEFLISNGDGREKAAAYVWGKIPARVAHQLAGRRGTWRSVAGWRDEWTGSHDPDRKAEAEGYRNTLIMMRAAAGEPKKIADKVLATLKTKAI